MNINLEYGNDIYKNYINFIKKILIDDELYASFKSNINYNGILEHVDENTGRQYFNQLSKELIHKCLENDKVGNPRVYKYDDIVCSPTTLRYIKFSVDICNFIKEWKEWNGKIIEIGGGYGGFCKVFLTVCKFMNIKINKYTILDLEDPAKLAKKYLKEEKGTEIITGTINDNYDHECDLLLAMYSYSEISYAYRKLYKPIIQNSIHGFMCWNVNNSNEEIELELEKDIKVENEVPLTGPFNRIIKW
jgi:hypothetical protein